MCFAALNWFVAGVTLDEVGLLFTFLIDGGLSLVLLSSLPLVLIIPVSL